MSNDELYEKAKNAIDELFNDTSVSQEEAKQNLESLISEIQIILDTLDID